MKNKNLKMTEISVESLVFQDAEMNGDTLNAL